MTIVPENAIDRILDQSWHAYQYAQAAIDTLESIGLNVDGNTAKSGTMSVLFGIMTAAGNAILAATGVPDAQPYSDEGLMLLSDATDEERAGDKFPGRIRRALAGIAETAFAKSMGPAPDNATPHEVTVSMTGSIQVPAPDTTSAMNVVSGLPTDMIIAMTCWEDTGPNPTDAYENG